MVWIVLPAKDIVLVKLGSILKNWITCAILTPKKIPVISKMLLYICVYIHRYMGTKTISIRDDVYTLLRNLKREEESFSDVIKKLVKKKKSNLGDYFGGLKDSKVLSEIEKDSKKIREAARIRA